MAILYRTIILVFVFCLSRGAATTGDEARNSESIEQSLHLVLNIREAAKFDRLVIDFIEELARRGSPMPEVIQERFKLLMRKESCLQAVARTYAAHFTVAELRHLNSMYSSEAKQACGAELAKLEKLNLSKNQQEAERKKIIGKYPVDQMAELADPDFLESCRKLIGLQDQINAQARDIYVTQVQDAMRALRSKK